MKKVFLGGTCTGYTGPRQGWRGVIMNALDQSLDFFDPVVDDWTEEQIAIEEQEKRSSDFLLYYILPDKMTGVYSIAEVIESCWEAKETNQKVIFCPELKNVSEAQKRSFNATGKLVKKNDGVYLTSLQEIISFLAKV